MMVEGLYLSGGDTLTDAQVARLQIFQGVNPQVVRQWVDSASIRSYPADTILLNPEYENTHIFILLQGKVSIHLGDTDSEVFAVVEQADLVGELSVLDGAHPGAYVKTMMPITALVLSKKALLEMIDNVHGVSRNLLYLVSDRMRAGSTFATKTKKLQKEYEEHANVDVLTGLYNRRWINSFFHRLLTRLSHSPSSQFSIALVDADHFKAFNDQHGHVAGDQALKSIAQTMRDSLRPTDIAARYGGEEFLIILPDTGMEDAQKAVERVRKAIESEQITLEGTRLPAVTISLGVTNILPSDDMESVIAAADKALYQAKSSGRNQACLIFR